MNSREILCLGMSKREIFEWGLKLSQQRYTGVFDEFLTFLRRVIQIMIDMYILMENTADQDWKSRVENEINSLEEIYDRLWAFK